METQIALYSSQGLRVLVVAKRIVPEESWPDLLEAVQAAESTAVPANIRQAYSALETNLTLLGKFTHFKFIFIRINGFFLSEFIRIFKLFLFTFIKKL